MYLTCGARARPALDASRRRIDQLGVGVGVMEHAGLLPDQQPAHRPVTPCAGAGPQPLVTPMVKCSRWLFSLAWGEIHFNIGFDLAPGGRGPGVEQQPGRPRINVERLGARMPDIH